MWHILVGRVVQDQVLVKHENIFKAIDQSLGRKSNAGRDVSYLGIQLDSLVAALCFLVALSFLLVAFFCQSCDLIADSQYLFLCFQSGFKDQIQICLVQMPNHIC